MFTGPAAQASRESAPLATHIFSVVRSIARSGFSRTRWFFRRVRCGSSLDRRTAWWADHSATADLRRRLLSRPGPETVWRHLMPTMRRRHLAVHDHDSDCRLQHKTTTRHQLSLPSLRGSEQVRLNVPLDTWQVILDTVLQAILAPVQTTKSVKSIKPTQKKIQNTIIYYLQTNVILTNKRRTHAGKACSPESVAGNTVILGMVRYS